MKLIKLEEHMIGGKKVTILVDAQTKGVNFSMAVWSTLSKNTCSKITSSSSTIL